MSENEKLSTYPEGNLQPYKESPPRDRRTWGEGIPTLANWSNDHACLNENCRLFGRTITDRKKNLVGVKEAPVQKFGKSYASIFRCPEESCQSIFWSHITDEWAEKLANEHK